MTHFSTRLKNNRLQNLRLCALLTFVLFAALTLFQAGTAYSAQVTLAWDANSEANLAGYRVHYGTSSGSYTNKVNVGKQTSATVAGLVDGRVYYFAVTAYNTAGAESGFSNEVRSGSSQTCTYSLSPASQSFSAAGGTGSVAVTAPSGCNWTASSSVPGITITSGKSGTGSGTVKYSVVANPTTSTRSASMTIAGKIFTVTQSGTGQTSTSYTIQATAGTGGTISPSGTVTAASGSSKTFTIKANSGYRIASVLVNGASVGALSTYTFTNISRNQTIQANFVAGTSTGTSNGYTVTVTKTGTGNGTVTASPTGPTYSSGTKVTLTAKPDANSVFAGWSGACSGTSLTCSGTVYRNIYATANFRSRY